MAEAYISHDNPQEVIRDVEQADSEERETVLLHVRRLGSASIHAARFKPLFVRRYEADDPLTPLLVAAGPIDIEDSDYAYAASAKLQVMPGREHPTLAVYPNTDDIG